MTILGFSVCAWFSLFLAIFIGLFVSSLMCLFLLVIHEYGHAYSLAKHGIRQEKIVLGWPRIFTTSVYGMPHEIGLLPVYGYVYAPHLLQAPANIRAEVAFAGPAASVFLGIFLLGFNWLFPSHLAVLGAQGSFAFAALNLVPLPPMDGWWIAEYGLSKLGYEPSPNVRRLLFGLGIASIGLSVIALQYYF